MGGKRTEINKKRANSKFETPQNFHDFGEAAFSLRVQPIPEEERGEIACLLPATAILMRTGTFSGFFTV
uniref:Uncharacterized protein n=1 Tax=Solanum tuberosum TaxID=4113 RepID=M1BDF7_SOLTU